DNAEGFAAADVERDVLEGPEVPFFPSLRPASEQPLGKPWHQVSQRVVYLPASKPLRHSLHVEHHVPMTARCHTLSANIGSNFLNPLTATTNNSPVTAML